MAFPLSVVAAWANLPTSWSREKYGMFLNSLTESSTSCPIRDSQPNVSHHRMPNQLKMTAVVTVSSQANHAGNSESRKRISTYFKSWFLKTPRVQVFIGRKRECSTLETFRPLSCGPRKTWSLSLYPDSLQSSSHESLSNAQVWSLNMYCSTKTSYSPEKENRIQANQAGTEQKRFKKKDQRMKKGWKWEESKDWALSCQTCYQQHEQNNVWCLRHLLCY